MKRVKEMRWAFTMHVKTKVFSLRKKERVVYLSWKKWMFISDLKWPCLILAVVPPVMHNHSCQISDKLLILPEELVAIRLPCSPCLWLSKRLMVIWSKHNTIDLSGGTIKTAANIKQLLDEVEHDIMNYQSRGLCYLLKPKAGIAHYCVNFLFHVTSYSKCKINVHTNVKLWVIKIWEWWRQHPVVASCL